MNAATNDTFQTMRQLVARNATLFPDKTAMKEFETGKSHTFSQLKERVERLGAALYGLGLSPLDRVAVLSQNSFEYAEPLHLRPRVRPHPRPSELPPRPA